MNQKMLNILFQTFWVLKCPSHIFNTFIGVWKEWFWSQTICQTMMTPELFLIIVRRHWRCWFISIFPWEGFPFVSSPKHGHWHSKEQRGAAPSKALPRILRNGTHHLVVGREVDKKKFQLSFPRYHPHHLCGETPVFQTFQAVLFLYRLDLRVGRHKSWQVGWDLRSEQDISCPVEATVDATMYTSLQCWCWSFLPYVPSTFQTCCFFLTSADFFVSRTLNFKAIRGHTIEVSHTICAIKTKSKN